LHKLGPKKGIRVSALAPVPHMHLTGAWHRCRLDSELPALPPAALRHGSI
jgi:hypothetical protein